MRGEFCLTPTVLFALYIETQLFEIATLGVTRGIAGQEAKYKQGDEKGDDNVNHNLEGYHISPKGSFNNQIVSPRAFTGENFIKIAFLSYPNAAIFLL